jgi:hypothetical protein
MALPLGRELDLLRLQYARKGSLFQCDRWAVYSSRKVHQLELAKESELIPRGVNMNDDWRVDTDSQWQNHLNTEVVVHTWRQVVQDEDFRLTDWTVKVDPDCVFFPGRLRAVLGDLEESESTFMLNCQNRQSMEAPFQVISRKAVSQYGEQWLACDQLARQYPDQAGVYMQSCLKLVGANSVESWSMFYTTACSKDADGAACDASHVSFWPLRSVGSWSECQDRSLAASGQ